MLINVDSAAIAENGKEDGKLIALSASYSLFSV